MKIKSLFLVLGLVLAFAATSCHPDGYVSDGRIGGALIGAAVGGAVDGWGGAAVGAAVGGLAGDAYGKNNSNYYRSRGYGHRNDYRYRYYY